LTALAASLILLALPAGALASISWSGASGVDRNGGTVISVSCPASDQCTAVDFAGQEITYNPTNNNVIETASINGTTALQAVSCSSTSQCTAVDGEGHEVTFDPTSGQSSDGPEVVDAGNTFYGLDCTSDTQCVATNHNGDAVVFNPRNVSGASTGCPDGSVGATCFAIDTGHNTERLSCWNNGTEECTAVDASGYEVTFDPTNPGTPTPVAVDADRPGDGDPEPGPPLQRFLHLRNSLRSRRQPWQRIHREPDYEHRVRGRPGGRRRGSPDLVCFRR
jgi:hypothetical protein